MAGGAAMRPERIKATGQVCRVYLVPMAGRQATGKWVLTACRVKAVAGVAERQPAAPARVAEERAVDVVGAVALRAPAAGAASPYSLSDQTYPFKTVRSKQGTPATAGQGKRANKVKTGASGEIERGQRALAVTAAKAATAAQAAAAQAASRSASSPT